MSAPRLTRIESAGLGAGLALAAVGLWPLRGYITDDTFIHLQFARHLAAGAGPVFNVGERVYGCTSPLWVAWIAGAMRLGVDGLAWAKATGLIATLASVALFFSLVRRTVAIPAARAAATVAWAGHAWMLRWALSGMETPLAVLLVLAGFVAWTAESEARPRGPWPGVLWALAALVRPEATLLLAAWAVARIAAARREGIGRAALAILPGGLLLGGWLAFAQVYFGSVWPQTLAAKAAGATGLAVTLDGTRRAIEVFLATDAVLLVTLALALLLGGARARAAARRGIAWLWLLTLPALYVARGVPVLSRYVLPAMPVLAWLAWSAACRWWAGETGGAARRAVWIGALVATAALAENAAIYRSAVLAHVTTFSPAIEASLVRWGRWFHDHSPRDAVIATPDIGAIGYFSDRRVVDLAGLVTPPMVPFLERETEEQAVAQFRFARFARPTFLVDRSGPAYALLTTSPYGGCLVPLGYARVPNLGVAQREPAVYSFYRVDWARFDSLRAARPR